MNRTRSLLAWLGITAQVVFTVLWLVAPAWQGPRYSVLAHSISDMYADGAPGGIAFVVVLTACGAATILFTVFGLLPAIRSAGGSAWAGCVLLALSIFGLGDLLTPFEREACRAADPGCTPSDQLANPGGALDATLSTIGIALLIAAAIFLFFALRSLATWRGFAAPVLVLGILIAIGFAADAFAPTGLGGLLERVLAALGCALFVVLGVAAFRSSRTSKR